MVKRALKPHVRQSRRWPLTRLRGPCAASGAIWPGRAPAIVCRAMNVIPAPDTPRTKGPLVFLDMDQQALDEAYDQEIYAPNRALMVERRKAASDQARAILGVPKRVTYGPSEYEGLDIFDCGIKGAPVNVFVHGGAWRRNVAADYALQAEPLIRAGAHCVLIDFINVDQAKGDLFPMYEQVRRALAWVWHNAASFGGDRDRLYISAHSSGSHLWRGADARPEGRGPAARCLQGRGAAQRHVRSRAGGAVEALVLRELHARHDEQAFGRALPRRPSYAAGARLSAPARRPSSSASPATSPPP